MQSTIFLYSLNEKYQQAGFDMKEWINSVDTFCIISFVEWENYAQVVIYFRWSIKTIQGENIEGVREIEYKEVFVEW